MKQRRFESKRCKTIESGIGKRRKLCGEKIKNTKKKQIFALVHDQDAISAFENCLENLQMKLQELQLLDRHVILARSHTSFHDYTKQQLNNFQSKRSSVLADCCNTFRAFTEQGLRENSNERKGPNQRSDAKMKKIKVKYKSYQKNSAKPKN
jgi:hypothetical protein